MPRKPATIPPSDSDHPLSQRDLLEQFKAGLEAGDRELLLATMRGILDHLAQGEERSKIREDSHQTVVAGLRETIEGLKSTIEEKDRELEAFRHLDELADKTRDKRLEGLEEFKVEASPYIKALAKETAPEVARINRPDTRETAKEQADATATAAAATALNAARKREQLLELAKWVAIVVTLVLGLLGVRLPDTKPNVSMPDTKPQPAGTGFAGAP